MRIKIEHLPPKGEVDKLNLTPNVRVYDKQTGETIGGIQKINISYEAGSLVPRATIETINFEALIDETEVDNIEITGYGPYYMKIEDMDRKQLIQALKYEAAMRFRNKHKIKTRINSYFKE